MVVVEVGEALVVALVVGTEVPIKRRAEVRDTEAAGVVQALRRTPLVGMAAPALSL